MTLDLCPAYGRAILGDFQIGSMRRGHRRIGRARDSMSLGLVLDLLPRLRVVESMGMGLGMGVRRMFPTLVRKLRHGPLCEGG